VRDTSLFHPEPAFDSATSGYRLRGVSVAVDGSDLTVRCIAVKHTRTCAYTNVPTPAAGFRAEAVVNALDFDTSVVAAGFDSLDYLRDNPIG